MMQILNGLKQLFGFSRPALRAPVGILIVDDSSGSRGYTTKLVRSFMERIGIYDYIMDVYGSYEEYIQGNGDRYDVAFIDWNLGSAAMTNGDRVVESLLENSKCSNIVIFSGMGDDSPIIAKFAIRHNIGYVHKGDGRQEYKLALALEKAVTAKIA